MDKIDIGIGSVFSGLSRTMRAAALAAPLALLAAAASAQTQITEQPERETTVTEEALRAAERARDLMATDEFEPATYAEVLKDPDNVELSFRLARTQVRNGDLHGAASTLERILLVDPNLTPVRLFYAVVLFRLEDLDESQREFQTVAAQEIPADVRAEVEAYITRIDYLRRKTRYTASLSLGAHYDTNRNATPRSGTVLLIDNPIELIDDDEDDFGYLGIASLRVDHDLGYQERHELFGALTYYQDEQVQQDAFDLQSYTVEAGGIYRQGLWGISVIPTAFATHLQLSRETYFRDHGLDLRFERDFGRRLTAFAGARLSYQNFDGIRESRAAGLRDGRQIEGLIGASYVISPTMRVTGDYLR